jgi:ParB/RepB/Spo0J family partition protein
MAKKLPSALNKNRAGTDRFDKAATSALLNPSAGKTAPLNSLVENPFNERVFYCEKAIQQRAHDIAERGLINPIIVAKHPDDASKLIVIDGHYRWRAAELLGWEEIAIEYKAVSSPKDFYLLSRDANRSRKESSVFDQAGIYVKLLEEKVYESLDELAEVEGKSKPSLSKIMSLNHIPVEARNLLATECEPALEMASAYELYLLWKVVSEQCADGENALDEFIAYCRNAVIENGVRRNEIGEYRAHYKASEHVTPTPRKAPNEPYRVFVAGNNKEVGKLNLDGKKVSFKLKVTSPEKAQELADAIAQLIKEHGHDEQ